MSVLVLSVIMVSLAPVVTKRVNDNISINNFKTEGVLFLVDETDPTRCNIISDVGGEDNEACTFQIPDKVTSINAVVVGNGGDGSNAVGNAEIHIIEPILTSQTKTFSPIMEYEGVKYNVKNLKIDYMVSGGAGGGAGWGGAGRPIEPKDQRHCNIAAGDIKEGDSDIPDSQATTMFIPAEYNGTYNKNLCVTKYNAGDKLGPTIPNSITRTGAGPASEGAISCDTTKTPCCWGGETYNGINGGRQMTAYSMSYCGASATWGEYSTSYSSCNRTVCTFIAAQAICENWEPNEISAGQWRLPSQAQIMAWSSLIANETSKGVGIISQHLGSSGLQLCDHYGNTYGSLQCQTGYDLCRDAPWLDCYPSKLWVDWGNGTHRTYELSKGVLSGPSDSIPGRASSVRCVLENILAPLTSNSGAGGGAGAHILNHTIQNGLLDKDIQLFITIGAGGFQESNGGDTIVKYKTTQLIAFGSEEKYSGEYGTIDNFGVASVIARRVHEINEVQTSYNVSLQQLGENGSNKQLEIYQTALGGNGGSSAYSHYLSGSTGTVTYSGGGAGGSISSRNGQNGQTPGSGGGGGTSTIDGSGAITNGAGGKGASGAVILSYDLVPIATPGSGGAGAGTVVGRGISVASGDLVQVSFTPTAMKIGENFEINANSGGSAIGATAGVADDDAGSVTGDRNGSFQYQKGSDGEQGGEIPTTTFMYGGTGGASGTGSQGGCGGLNTYIYADSTVFTNSSTCVFNVPTNIEAYGSDGAFNVVEKSVISNSFGSAGSGGGGGGFSTDVLGNPIQGQGGKGANGYVYIWWIKNE